MRFFEYLSNDFAMPLSNRDNDVNAMDMELPKLTKAPSKTEAVRQALSEMLETPRDKMTLGERLDIVKQQARVLGLPNREFDMKQFSDEMWDDD